MACRRRAQAERSTEISHSQIGGGSDARERPVGASRFAQGNALEVTLAGAWVIRSGKHGEREQWALDNGVSGGGWAEVPDLTGCTSRADIGAVVSATWPTAPEGMLSNYTGQLWALRNRIEPGDLLVMPLKAIKKVAFGRVTSGYHYRAADPDPNKRHVVDVDWIRADLARTAIKQDLLFTLGSAMSIFTPTKNNAAARLTHLLAHGTDPGSVAITSTPATSVSGIEQAVDEPELSANIEEVALDRITAKVSEEFAGHGLATLVAAILEAEGYWCAVSPPGPDGGVDISAGRGPLGLDNPRLLAQVKSGAQIGVASHRWCK